MKPGLGKATPAWTSTRIKVIDISEVNRIVDLLKKVDCTNYAMISDVSKEMGIKKTALMQFIVDNPKLFSLVEVTKKGKSAGLGIRVVYETPNQNPETEEWLADKKVEWEKKIHISSQYYYNQLEFYHIAVDNNDGKKNLYRNTPEKIQELEEAGLITKSECWYGGFSDSYKIETYRVNSDVIKKIEEAGWATDWEEVIAKSKE